MVILRRSNHNSFFYDLTGLIDRQNKQINNDNNVFLLYARRLFHIN